MPAIEIVLPASIPFKRPPVMVGTMAKYYYDIGPRSERIDFVIHESDFAIIHSHFPSAMRWVGLDQVIDIDHFRFRRSIELFHYDIIRENAIQHDNFMIISLDRLYFITVVDSNNHTRGLELDRLVQRMRVQSGATN